MDATKASRTVLAINASDMPSGFSDATPRMIQLPYRWLDTIQAFYTNKDAAETDDSLLQLIPYLVVSNEGRILSYQRGTAGEEARLHALRSVGIGGHVDVEDYSDFSIKQTLCNAGNRELYEELGGNAPVIQGDFTHAVYDPSTPVGRVHLGLVMHVRSIVHNAEHYRPEDSIQDLRYIAPDELKRDHLQYEMFSRLVIDGLDSM